MLKSYCKTAIRFLLKNKTFSFINIFGLALGTLSCLYILLYVQDQYSYDKQHNNVQDIYRLNTFWTTPASQANWATTTAPVAPAMQKDFPEVIAYARIVPAINIDYHLLRYNNVALYEKDAVYADTGLFSMFHFHFVWGNEKDALAMPYSMVLIKPVAYKLFGNTNPVGKVITMDNQYGKHNFTVNGVIDEDFGKSHIHANIFMSMNSGGLGRFTLDNNSWTGMNVIMSYVKLRPGTNATALEKKFPAFVNKYGSGKLKNAGMTKTLHLQQVSTIHTTPGFKGLELTKPISPSFLYILIIIGVLIQVIACINFMNLSTARAGKRAKEVGVRKVAGAGKRDLVKQFLGESLLLSFAGVAVALPLLMLLLPYLNMITSANIQLGFFSDYRFWLSLTALVLITGLLAGSYPAFYLSAFQVVKVIKGNFTSHISAAGIRRSLVVFQFVLSIVLIAVIVVIYSQLNYMKTKDLGFDKDEKIVFSFYTDDAVEKMPAFSSDLRKLADVNAVSRAAKAPGEMLVYDMSLYKAGGNYAAAVNASFQQADEYFLKATGIKLIAGRDFRQSDSSGIIINETLAKQLGLPLDKAPGTTVYSQYNGETVSYEIAGVIKDYNFSSLHENIKPELLMYTPRGGRELIVSATSNNYKTLLANMQNIWRRHFADIPFTCNFIDEEVQRQYGAEITLSNIINSFTLIAILISCLGLFGLAAFSAEQRTKEISIRKILGASVTGITGLLSKEFVKLVLIAFVIASPIAWWVMKQWLLAFAYKVTISWWMFAEAGLLALFIAMATVSTQAIKAALANPVKSLRSA